MIKSKQIQRPQLVLVVDDHEINRDVLGVILEDDYEVIYAENGRECLEQMRKHAGTLSIVLLDLFMPQMTGFEVLEYVKQDEELKGIPIIVLTAEKSAELQALEMGAADFITKPFDMSEIILARVGRMIELSEGRELISAAEYDRLTSLYSRNFFFEYVNRLFRYRPEMKMDALVVNIEQFHTINALNGREFGDLVLGRIGEAIREFLGGTEGIASRIEADRFEIYCVSQPDYRAVLDFLQEKAGTISRKVNIQLRMGVKPWQEGMEPVLMFDHARTACNKVRGNYQNPIMVYNDQLREKELMDGRLLNDLLTASSENQFVVYYQPKYNIQCDPPKLVSAEALIRWKHPEMGMISPGTFVPLFEGKGLIGVVDDFVWKEAAGQVAKWREHYGYTIPVSVNLSRSDLFDPTLVERLDDLVHNNGLNYKDIKLEITESSFAENARRMLEVISSLQERGFEIEMDDFGSGYSSLNMLSEMPVDVLKMDMRFVRDIEANETDRRLITLIIDIAKYLSLPVVAEGVENEAQLGILRDRGCEIVQGYYFSRPLPPEEFEKLIEQELALERS